MTSSAWNTFSSRHSHSCPAKDTVQHTQQHLWIPSDPIILRNEPETTPQQVRDTGQNPVVYSIFSQQFWLPSPEGIFNLEPGFPELIPYAGSIQVDRACGSSAGYIYTLYPYTAEVLKTRSPILPVINDA
jgi:hypothetical protein